MAVGALKTLMATLSASAYLSGVSVAFGEESIDEQDRPLPLVVIVPIGGEWGDGPGYISGSDPQNENTWPTKEMADIYCWAFSSAANAQPIDHADAVETLRQQVLSAFQDQRNQQANDGSSLPGLFWKPVRGEWMTDKNTVNRYGRAYKFTVMTEISVPMLVLSNNQATITSETINSTVTGGQHVA